MLGRTVLSMLHGHTSEFDFLIKDNAGKWQGLDDVTQQLTGHIWPLIALIGAIIGVCSIAGGWIYLITHSGNDKELGMAKSNICKTVIVVGIFAECASIFTLILNLIRF